MVQRALFRLRSSRRAVALTSAAVLGTTGLLLVGSPSATAVAVPGAVCSAGTCTITVAETGAPQTWTVPEGVASITVTVAAGSGGASRSNLGGAGGKFTATFPVTVGHTLSIVVGAAGADGQSATSTAARC